MYVIVLLLMVALVSHDPAGLSMAPWPGGAWMLLAALGPYAAIALGEWLACRWALRSLRHVTEPQAVLRRLEMVLTAGRFSLVALFVIDLYVLGWLVWLRQQIGDTILFDELLAVGPPLIVGVLGWSSYYPVDRRVRRMAARQLPAQPTWPVGTREHYVLTQLRHQVLLIFVPMAAVLAWMEGVEQYLGPREAWRPYQSIVAVAGFVVIFAFAPVMIRYVWDTVPLPDPHLRDQLLEMCRAYRVRVRRLLMWRTYGGMVNGAVMGVIGPLRFILLTDGLLARMSYPAIEAVMAHELGHVRRRHMIWLLVCAMATIYGLEAATRYAIAAAERMSGWSLEALGPRGQEIAAIGSLLIIVPVWLVVFGWISRRFERQADAFAVQHLSRRYPDETVLPGRVGGIAVHIYCDALRCVATMNHCPLDRRSWRHGSIQWRCDHLRRLIGTPLEQCPIDRTVRWICMAAATGLGALLIYGL